MSTERTPEEITQLSGDAAADGRSWSLWVGMAAVSLAIPAIMVFSALLWAEPEARLFPVGFLGIGLVAGLLAWREKACEPARVSRFGFTFGLLILGALLCALGTWYVSLSLLGAALAVLLVAWAMGTTDLAWPRLLGIGFLTALVLDVFGFVELGPWIREMATWFTSGALDALEVANLRNGSLLELDGLTLYAERICGNQVDSVYGLFLLTTIYLMLSHRGLLIGLKALIAVPFWVMLRDFLMLLAIALTHHFYGRDMSSGWDYLLLRLALDAWILLSVWLHIRLMARFTEPIPPSDAEFGPIFSALNKAACWPQPDPFENMEPEDPDEARHFRKLQAQRAEYEANRPRVDWTQFAAFVWTVRISCVVVGVCSVVLLISLALGKVGVSFFGPAVDRAVATRVEQFELQPDASFGALAAVEPGNGGATLERVWRGKLGKHEYELRLEYPSVGNDGFIELRESLGWTVLKRAEFDSSMGRSLQGERVELVNELGGAAYAWTLSVNNALDGVPPSELSGARFQRGVTVPGDSIVEVWGAEGTQSASLVLLRLFVDSGDELSRIEQQAFERLLGQTFGQLLVENSGQVNLP